MKTHKTNQYYTLAVFYHLATSASRGKEIVNNAMYEGTEYK